MPNRSAYKHVPEAQSTEAFYLDILEGFAAYADSDVLRNLAAAVQRYPAPDLAHALNKNQMASKLWLCDRLANCLGRRLGRVCVLAGWKGVLPAMLAADPRLTPAEVISVDIDPECAEVAGFLARRWGDRVRVVTADMLELDYAALSADLLINTSCEHLADFADWYARIPHGTLVALQSNDMTGVDVHLNCVADLDAFRAQAPLAHELYAGTLPRKRYTRFMLIGRK